jgi:hypothetical protein
LVNLVEEIFPLELVNLIEELFPLELVKKVINTGNGVAVPNYDFF